MTTIADIKSDPDTYEGLLLADGFEEAFLGVGFQFNNAVALYSRSRCLRILELRGMSSEDAVEFFDFNVTGSYVGLQTPVFIYDDTDPGPEYRAVYSSGVSAPRSSFDEVRIASKEL